jgi:hypothetical protein
MTEKRQTSQGYIIRILQHFATKLRNITNFVMLFQAVMKFLSRLVEIKISLKRGKVYCESQFVTHSHWLDAQLQAKAIRRQYKRPCVPLKYLISRFECFSLQLSSNCMTIIWPVFIVGAYCHGKGASPRPGPGKTRSHQWWSRPRAGPGQLHLLAWISWLRPGL